MQESLRHHPPPTISVYSAAQIQQVSLTKKSICCRIRCALHAVRSARQNTRWSSCHSIPSANPADTLLNARAPPHPARGVLFFLLLHCAVCCRFPPCFFMFVNLDAMQNGGTDGRCRVVVCTRAVRNALKHLSSEIRSATTSMTSVPKPLKFLRPHYAQLKKCKTRVWTSGLDPCVPVYCCMSVLVKSQPFRGASVVRVSFFCLSRGARPTLSLRCALITSVPPTIS